MSKRNIAIIGAGISGLSAAHYLHKAGHCVTVFEAENYPGGHSNTVTVETPQGICYVDTGFIVFNENNYPNFEQLLDEIGIASQRASMSFSVNDPTKNFEWSTRPLGLFASPARIVDRDFYRMFYELLRFHRELKTLLNAGSNELSLRDFLKQHKYSEYFVNRFIIPQAAAVWSADPQQLWSFPALFLAEFFENHQIAQILGRPKWRTICDGSQAYVQKLIEPFRKNLHLNTAVKQVERHDTFVEVKMNDAAAQFDCVVFATHADQTLALLADPSTEEQTVLERLPYQANEAVLHTDSSIMPKHRRVWSSWNYHIQATEDRFATVTYYMNRLQSLQTKTDFFVTLNQREAISEERIIQRFRYAHPVYTTQGRDAQKLYSSVSGKKNTYYCGAYWRWGFHEDGVWSALRACQQLDASSIPKTAIL